jgi:hypothetical protein
MRTCKRPIVSLGYLFIFFKEEKEGNVKLSLGQGKRRNGKVDSPGVITILTFG